VPENTQKLLSFPGKKKGLGRELRTYKPTVQILPLGGERITWKERRGKGGSSKKTSAWEKGIHFPFKGWDSVKRR